MEFNEIIEKERQIFRETSWYEVMKLFIESKEFELPFADACHSLNNGERFYPSLSNVFNAFKYCDIDNLKMVLFNTDHYIPSIHTYNGLCLSEQINKDTSNYTLYKKLKLYVENKQGYALRCKALPMLEYAKQGVLCLNDALIMTENIERSRKMWKPFMTYFFEMMKDKNAAFISIGYCPYKMDYMETRKPVNMRIVVDNIEQILKEKNIEPIKW